MDIQHFCEPSRKSAALDSEKSVDNNLHLEFREIIYSDLFQRWAVDRATAIPSEQLKLPENAQANIVRGGD